MLLLAGGAKLANLAEFRSAVANYRLLPGAAVRPAAAAVPIAEVVTAGCLLAGIAVPFMAAAAGAMLLAFSVAVGINLVRGRELDCGCFGAATPRRLSWWTVGRNTVLMAVAAVVVAGQPSGLALWTFGAPVATPPANEVVASAALALVAVTGVLVAHESWLVQRRLRTMPGSARARGSTP